MRVTEQQTFKILANNLQRARAVGLGLQEQVSTGKKVQRASDDPSAFNHIALDKSSIAVIEQRLRNISFGRTRIDLTDRLLSSANETLSRVLELAVQFRNDTYGPAQRANGAQEVRELFAQLQQYANTELNGHSVFTGTSTQGRASGLAISPPATLTNGVNDTLVVTVDGITSGAIDLTSGTESLAGPELAARVQSRVNADGTLVGAGKQVTVTFDQDHLVIASNTHGEDSVVAVIGGTAGASLGFNGGSSATGRNPFALTATAAAASTNSGGAVLSQGRVVDEQQVTLSDYMIRFSSPTVFDVYDVTVPVNVTRGSANTGGAVPVDAGVIDAADLTLQAYQIQFTSSTQYSIVNTTTAAVLSSGNTYVSGNDIQFDGLRVRLANGQQAGPQAGDTFDVRLTPSTVLANQAYTSGTEISFKGLGVTIGDGSGTPAAGDRFSLVTGVHYLGDAGVQSVEVGNSQTIATNVTGDRVFTSASVDLFASIKQLATALRGNDREGIAQALGKTNLGLHQIASVHVEVGALSNRFTANAGRLDDSKAFFSQTLSDMEDVDMAKAISDLMLQQFAIEAASRALTQVFENSLLKYLR
jgi:flagellar hook-associated protein 3 FlgL